MALAQWISLVVIALLPMIWGITVYIAHLPEQVRTALPLFALMAVQEVEQTQRNFNESISKEAFNESKKELAVASVVKHFKAFPFFPVPSRDRIEAAIESAVFQLKTRT